MILVYTPKTTNRVRYIFEFIFQDILQTEVSFTNNDEEINAHQGPVINYSNQKIDNTLFFESSGFLFEKGIQNGF